MQIDPATHSQADTYKLLTNVVVPRPIAWVTSLNQSGIVNLAPFSFFNAVGSNPPYVVVSIGLRDDGTQKDTALNIERRGEFVVNLVTEALLGSMNISAADFPPDESELTAAGLHTAPSTCVAVPLLAEAEVSLECRLFQSHALGENTLFIGEIAMFHVSDHLLGPRLRISNFAPIGRLGSPSMYCRTADRFELPRISYAEWHAQRLKAQVEPP
jgi:flavin reductase (DIM6/NTAB) family NADH-FMN oxidoreductase RutF